MLIALGCAHIYNPAGRRNFERDEGAFDLHPPPEDEGQTGAAACPCSIPISIALLIWETWKIRRSQFLRVTPEESGSCLDGR